MTVCERVKKYIDDNEIKQVTVARKAGMPIATFNAMINGKRKMYADDLQRMQLYLLYSERSKVEPVIKQTVTELSDAEVEMYAILFS